MATASQFIRGVLDAILPHPERATVRQEEVAGVVVVVVELPGDEMRFAVWHQGRNVESMRVLLKSWSGLHSAGAFLKVVKSDGIAAKSAAEVNDVRNIG